MNIEDLSNLNIDGINIDIKNKDINININNDVNETELLNFLKDLFDLELKNSEFKFFTRLKDISDMNLLGSAIKYALTREDLRDALMLLNIINLVKIYNSLDDSFFKNKDIYVSSVEELLDLKLSIRKEIKEFSKKLSIYFISLIKSYNKVNFTPLDNHVKLPEIYSYIILSTDFLTLAGIFSTSEEFSTSECIYIDEAFKYISTLLTKNLMAIDFMDEFLRGVDNGSSR